MSLLTLYMCSNNNNTLFQPATATLTGDCSSQFSQLADGQHITSHRSTNNSLFCCCMSDIIIPPAGIEFQVAVMSLTARPPGASSFKTKYDIARYSKLLLCYSSCQPRLDPALKALRPMRKEM